MNVWDFGKILARNGILTEEQVARTTRLEIVADVDDPGDVKICVTMIGDDGRLSDLVKDLGKGSG